MRRCLLASFVAIGCSKRDAKPAKREPGRIVSLHAIDGERALLVRRAAVVGGGMEPSLELVTTTGAGGWSAPLPAEADGLGGDGITVGDGVVTIRLRLEAGRLISRPGSSTRRTARSRASTRRSSAMVDGRSSPVTRCST